MLPVRALTKMQKFYKTVLVHTHGVWFSAGACGIHKALHMSLGSGCGHVCRPDRMHPLCMHPNAPS
jgi:hypothetical protein